MCLFLSTLLLGPRAAILIWWLFAPGYFSDAFNSFIWPLLGLIILPWTTLMYLIVWSYGDAVSGIDWVFIALGVFLDIGLHAGGGIMNRQRVGY